MNKAVLSFVINHLDKAIWNLECANKLDPGIIPKETIASIKEAISDKRKELWGKKECEDM